MSEQSLDAALRNLNESFSAVAKAIEAELPDVWRVAAEGWSNPSAAVFILTSPHPAFGKSPLEVARESQTGRQAVVEHLHAILDGAFA